MNKKSNIIPLPIREDLDELFGYLWHLRNPIEAIKIDGINGIEGFHKQLHALKNSLHKLLIHIKNLLPNSNYLIDDLKRGFNINKMTKIDSGVHSLDSINEVDIPIIEGSYVDLSESTRWSESQVINFKNISDGHVSKDVSLARKLSQQFNINRATLEKYLEHFKNDIAEHIKNIVDIPSTTDKIKLLIKDMYEEEKEKINQKAVDDRDKVKRDMHSRGLLGSSIHRNRLEKVELDRIESLWKKRIEIEVQVRQGDINESTSQEIYNKVSNIIEAEIEASQKILSKINIHSGVYTGPTAGNLDKKKKEFLVAAKRRIDIEIGKRALRKTKATIPKENKDFKQFLQTQFDYDIAISFAGENREIAEQITKVLREKGIRVFYDELEEEKVRLWGKNLREEFMKIYGGKARYAVVLISQYYPIKDWANFEFNIAKDEAKRRKKDYILPVRLDDTKIVGLKYEIKYIDLRKEGIDGVVNLIIKKLSLNINE